MRDRPAHGGGCGPLVVGVVCLLLALVAGAGAWTAAEARFNRWPTVAPYNAKLNRMAMCESTMDWRAVSANGRYLGGLQFDMQTWRSVGGRGMPHTSSRIEQKYRAVLLIRRRGYAPWPICGKR